MKKIAWWDKAWESWFRLKDEVIKVSQLGRTGLSRSFLIHERMKLSALLGEQAYRWIAQHGSEDPLQSKLVDQIEKMNAKIRQMEEKVSGITHDLSLNLNAEVGNDAPLKRRSSARKKKN